MTARRFVATHVIVGAPSDCGGTSFFPVRLVDGAFYTREEWDACARADWEFSAEDGLTFQGRVIDGASIEAVRS